jgi:hypothetical protein
LSNGGALDSDNGARGKNEAKVSSARSEEKHGGGVPEAIDEEGGPGLAPDPFIAAIREERRNYVKAARISRKDAQHRQDPDRRPGFELLHPPLPVSRLRRLHSRSA